MRDVEGVWVRQLSLVCLLFFLESNVLTKTDAVPSRGEASSDSTHSLFVWEERAHLLLVPNSRIRGGSGVIQGPVERQTEVGKGMLKIQD